MSIEAGNPSPREGMDNATVYFGENLSQEVASAFQALNITGITPDTSITELVALAETKKLSISLVHLDYIEEVGYHMGNGEQIIVAVYKNGEVSATHITQMDPPWEPLGMINRNNNNAYPLTIVRAAHDIQRVTGDNKDRPNALIISKRKETIIYLKQDTQSLVA